MFYYLYQITNLVNNKIYIGVHATTDMNDGYMGSGKNIQSAIKKYGIVNFKKDILFTFNNTDGMYAKEKEIVTEEFLLRKDTYNLRLGGTGGFDFINKNNLYGFSDSEVARKGRQSTNALLQDRLGTQWKTIISEQGNNALKKKREDDPAFNQQMIDHARRNVKIASQYANTSQSIEKKKSTFIKIGHQQGVKNSQYGKMWITNGNDNKSIPGHETIPEGWRRGRILS
jgi:phosphatidylserine/phosphatidylglycerophosphate/cardiolipin synthase-like enzyme